MEETCVSSEEGGTRRLSRPLKLLIASPAVLLVAASIRLLIISNYDTTTATSAASQEGVTGTLLGTIVPLIPPYLPVVILILFLLHRWISLLLALFGVALVSPA